jgi:class 3 adenylate cyclase
MDYEIRYARSGDAYIAYGVYGSGPLDVVVVTGFAWHLEINWEHPLVAAWWKRWASFARVVTIDKRGTGLSDRVPPAELPNLEQRMDDVRAVMDHAGIERAAVLGFWEGGPMCALFAATYPERTTHLVLHGAPAVFERSADYPWAPTAEENQAAAALIPELWGSGDWLGRLMPSKQDDSRTMQWLAKMERNSASPGAAIALWRMNTKVDVRDILPAIHVPTLVINRIEDPVSPVEGARYVAARIPGARLVELGGVDHLPFMDDDETVVGEIRQFLTGTREQAEVDRILATVLFVDIVASTERAVELGDRLWRERLEGFYAAAREELERHRGVEVNTTGDGLLARFDGPARAIRCASALIYAGRQLALEVRAGLHTGECEVLDRDLGGIAVHIGARVAGLADAGEVYVSRTVKDLVAGSGIEFVDCGRHALKGVPGDWEVHRVLA